MGSAWVGVYVDGAEHVAHAWGSLAVGRWMHLHLNAAAPLAYDLVLMGAKRSGGSGVRSPPAPGLAGCESHE
jgi:hypothetical protein